MTTAFGVKSNWRDTPQAVLEAIELAESGVAALQEIARKMGLDRKFTLDGRLVGDIGELLLCHDFNVIPGASPDGHAHDLVGESHSGPIQVQVKLRRATKTGRFEFKYQPQCLVVIECSEDWHRWRIIYNGPGSIVIADDVTVRPGDRRILRGGEPAEVCLRQRQLEQQGAAIESSDPRLTLRRL